MIVNLFDAFNILGGDNGGLSRSLIGDDTVYLDDSITYANTETDRSPGVLLDCPDDPLLKVVVIRCRIRNLTVQAGDSAQ
jgi:hypothetical protein